MSDWYLFISITLISFGLMLIIYLSITRFLREKQLQVLSGSNQKTKENELGGWLKSKASELNPNEEEIKQKLRQAGWTNTQYVHLFMPIKYSVLLIGEVIFGIAYYQSFLSSTAWVIAASLWVVFVIIAPDMYLQTKIKARIHRVSTQMPYLLDLMAVCVQTGMTVEASLSYLAKEMKGFNKDLTQVLTKMNERSRMVGLEKSLEEMYVEIPSNEMRSFVMTLTQSMHYGSSIYSVLTTLASDIREVQMLELEERIGKLAAKMSVPLIVFIMIPIVILIAAPGVMRLMLNA
ncbi:type II secretion system F family protein [Aliivibrio sp. S2TY2]|uniref:type II secretion system F family protein n=1 Tax=unclassified Aliivibrio TaxID=2645654 RepID=UPI0023785205|nr:MULTISPECIES: type II secretion system F family protein [unclassified Aliivibrio]MDD9175396.1 type II secretion system F family protein [Aliivibrio sp. S3TY1]MDD9192475.1 type II secretion system F family protein [Aliivibrio sp. S2TY2]